MQFTKNIKDRHEGGEFGWIFENIHQRINDKVGQHQILSLKCHYRVKNKPFYKG